MQRVGETGNDVAIEVVDVTDTAALQALAARTRILVSCIGPVSDTSGRIHGVDGGGIRGV